MQHKTLNLNKENFKRKTGVRKETFQVMLLILRTEREKLHKVGGRVMKLLEEDQLLMTLEYLREYITYFSLGIRYGISESNCYKIIKKTEDTLIKSGVFNLPNKNEILNSNNIKRVAFDATETKVERPKKNKETHILERKNTTPKKKSLL
jgi:hypothetical protein